MPGTTDGSVNGWSDSEINGTPKKSHVVHGKLICCFDGTGNKYSGTPSDTNIVKLYQKFDRNAARQFHYYQPGIGTYVAGDESVNTGMLGRIKRWWTETVDLGLGTSFDHHVIAGYRFIMRYHEDNDKIFIFGFSRGAFTARFLARMISTVGLLSKGNEEMVPFAYKTYQEYEMGIGFKTAQEHERYMQNFKTTFCRQKAKVHFLGLFDTVNSVGYFDVPFQKKTYLPTVLETATHVRHAVAIDERRCKFKVALLQQDKRQAKTEHKDDDIKEVFFPGNHGDVGGGWAPEGGNSFQDEAEDPLQLSDLALEWMICELDALPKKHPTDQIEWNEHKDIFLRNFHRKVETAVKAPMHDILRYGGGVSRTSTFMWRIMEWLPFFKRLELIKGQWKPIFFPPNMGGTRDIPDGSVFHPSVRARMQLRECHYHPTNDGFKV